MTFATTHGTTNIRAKSAGFLSAFTRRVETGLLSGAPASRSRYLVTQKHDNTLRFRAETYWTAINVGLNDVQLTVDSDGLVTYTIRFLRWAGYVLGLGAALGIILVVMFTTIDLRSYIAAHRGSSVPGLSIDQNVTLAWGMVLFWALVWPWILIACHKRPLRRLMNRIIAEVDAVAMNAAR